MNNHLYHKTLQHFNTPGYAHGLTSSCYHCKPYFKDPVACKMFIEDLDRSRSIYNFHVWAYVVMPHHIHIIILPLNKIYDISTILSGIKGVMAKRYRKYLIENDYAKYESFLVKFGNRKEFVFWQRGGGYDQNIIIPKSIHKFINYIEANPVKAHFVASADQWQWSSAYAKAHNAGVIPDMCSIPPRQEHGPG